MSRLKELFVRKPSGLLNIYCTAGYPNLDDTMTVLQSLQEAGVDIIELGIPYSDPLADGPVIQQSSARALKNGMRIPVLFDQLKEMRPTIHVPLILMGYLNPVLRYGFEKFCQTCAELGIDGLIIPDIPMYEYETHYKKIVEQYGLDFIFLVTPETTEDRIRKFDSLGSGFIYAVSSSAVTGGKNTVNQEYLQRLKSMRLTNPILVGFGISDQASFEQACSLANGAIIGSAYIKALKGGDIERETKEFVMAIRERTEQVPG